jgi:hypothetical protein
MARRTRETTQRRSNVVSLHIELLEDRVVPAGIVAVGSGPGGPPIVHVYDALTGSPITSFLAYDSHFLGGVRVALVMSPVMECPTLSRPPVLEADPR